MHKDHFTYRGLTMAERRRPQHVLDLTRRAIKLAHAVRRAPTAEQVEDLFRLTHAIAAQALRGRHDQLGLPTPLRGPRDFNGGRRDSTRQVCSVQAEDAWDWARAPLGWLLYSVESEKALAGLDAQDCATLLRDLRKLREYALAVHLEGLEAA